MRITTARRISQVFFVLLFLWFCIAGSLGLAWWQLRGWPVNWFLQLDPLVAVGTLLTTGTLYAGLLWALVTVVLTILLGRFFCGWVCPFGTMHQFVGYLGRRGKGLQNLAADNQPRPAQRVKYYILIVLLTAAAGALLARGVRALLGGTPMLWVLLGALAVGAFAAAFRPGKKNAGLTEALWILLGVWTLLAFFLSVDEMVVASLQTGLLDPIPLVYRSVSLVLLPLADAASQTLSPSLRHYEVAWLIGGVFLAAILLNLKTPRFYCRYICPLGALLGILSRFALWRIGTAPEQKCTECRLCEAHCEGACEPAGEIKTHECVLCMNCFKDCKHARITYSTAPSASGEISAPDLSRRGFVVGLVGGLGFAPVVSLAGWTGPNWNPAVVRPPGALREREFLERCIKCGQCMRICPTNIIHPAGLQGGLEGLWTPVLNFRIGSSGCQLNCTACSHICPTAAIRSISLEEKLGLGQYEKKGPIRLGTAFVDRGRCLPWAMDRPCIVCQENCPVSPKAIFVRESFTTVRGGVLQVKNVRSGKIEVEAAGMEPDRFATGDYYAAWGLGGKEERRRIVSNTDRWLTLETSAESEPPSPGGTVAVQVRLKRPYVDPEQCIGCGVCEHECPVSGRRAIRVTAENESRNRKHSLLP